MRWLHGKQVAPSFFFPSLRLPRWMCPSGLPSSRRPGPPIRSPWRPAWRSASPTPAARLLALRAWSCQTNKERTGRHAGPGRHRSPRSVPPRPLAPAPRRRATWAPRPAARASPRRRLPSPVASAHPHRPAACHHRPLTGRTGDGRAPRPAPGGGATPLTPHRSLPSAGRRKFSPPRRSHRAGRPRRPHRVERRSRPWRGRRVTCRPPPPATHGSRSVKAPPPTRWRARRPAAPAAAR